MCLNSAWEVYQCHKLVVLTGAFAFKAMGTNVEEERMNVL